MERLGTLPERQTPCQRASRGRLRVLQHQKPPDRAETLLKISLMCFDVFSPTRRELFLKPRFSDGRRLSAVRFSFLFCVLIVYLFICREVFSPTDAAQTCVGRPASERPGTDDSPVPSPVRVLTLF